MDLTAIDDAARTGNVANLFDRTAAHHGDAQAMEHHGRRWTHADVRDWTAELAGGFHGIGLEPGDRALLFLPNCPQYLIASIGAFKAGVEISPVNPQYKRREVAYQLADTDASAVITHPALRDVVAQATADADMEPAVITIRSEDWERDPDDHAFEELRGEPTLVERADDDVALLPYTSGTTGDPKGVKLTHENTRAQLMWPLTASNVDVEPADVRSLTWLPLYHITGFTHTALQPLVGGGRLYFRSALEWDARECLQLIEDEGITHFVGVTTMYADMVELDDFGEYDLTSLESASEGGAKLSTAVQERFEETAGVDIAEGYGLTETHGATHTQSGSTFGLKHGTIGQPLRMTDCKIVDDSGADVGSGEEGELLVRGPQVMAGYLELPEATAAAFTENGFLRTGDIARRDRNNYYEIVDRKKHMINTAGYNVYPSELEELILEHEAVADVAVVGIPDERRNEVPKAFVVTSEGVTPGSDVTAEEITEFCLAAVASYKHPREVEFVAELPRTTSGKIQKYKLEERAE
ncbi:class I adenylate-forming enzyme family protein [Natrinema pallidum]|uniref:AMP-dependent synthetase and ligase n=2 Tax=Natrinema pallidum TaxID=69527 RepID=L9YJZ0_9EURY|nr:AMP-binding protein [Natrinema pallidum]ELY74475.1 AMP-dependent synthetase and ligase [Natrinema pallidum DSM 3751]QCW03913.1 long-chain fatty acid--CoA ligase [Natrinema pallidum]